MAEKKYINYRLPRAKFGKAITYTYEKEDGTMWVGNNEYESQVNFCPVTGRSATKQMDMSEEIKFEGSVCFIFK